MNKTTTLILLILLILLCLFVVEGRKNKVAAPMACTQDAMQCPDGSYVGRTGPQCQFAVCPQKTVTTPPESQLGTVKGVVDVSPVCGGPVRNPPDPNCVFRAYATTITFTNSSGRVFSTTSNSNGNYSINLASGTYTVQAHGGDVYPTCPSESITVRQAQTMTKNITCDSGLL